MFRFNQQQDSSKNFSTKTLINNSPNLFYPQQKQKSTFALHQSEVSAQKSVKKGIRTTVSYLFQNTQEQSSEKVIYVNKKSDHEYVKSLEIQIASRERERIEIHKNLQDLKRQNAKLTYELNEERKKSASFRMKTQQLEIFLKQNYDKQRAVSNEKDQLFNQCQFQIQRRKNIEEVQQKLRFKFEAIQLELNNKTNQNIVEINKVSQENKILKQQIQKLNHQLKALQFSNEMSQIKLQSQNVKKNYEGAKENFKRQLQVLVNEGSRMREVIIQLQNEKSINKSCITVMQRQIQALQKQKSQETHRKLTLSQQLQKQRISFQHQIFSCQEKLKKFEKIIEKKNLQYQELQKHFNQMIERQNQQHTNQIQKYLQQLQSMGKRLINTSNQDFLIKKISLLQECLSKKQAEVKILEDNNALLRKNFINSLTEQQNLREEIKTNRSHYSQKRNQSVQKSLRDMNQQLRKSVFKMESQHLIQSELEGSNKQMNLSLKQRSNSNSQLKNSKFRDHQRSYKYVPPLSLRNIENSEVQCETQRPVSNIPKPHPFDPLNVKKIRERNQFHYSTQVCSNTKSTRETKTENCNSDSLLTTSQVIPISLQQSLEKFTLKQHKQLCESEEQF